MVLRYTINFVDWADLIRFIVQGGTNFTLNSNPATVNFLVHNEICGVYNTVTDSNFTSIDEWEYTGSVKVDSSGTGIGIEISDGVSWIKIRLAIANPNTQIFYGYDTNRGSNTTQGGDNPFIGTSGDFAGIWVDLRIIKDSSDNFSFSWKLNSSDTWISLGSLNRSFTTITEIDTFGIAFAGGSGGILTADDLTITREFTLNPEGLDGSIEFDSYDLSTALNVGGSGTMVSPSPFYVQTSAATYIADQKKQLSYLNSMNFLMFRGEVSLIETKRHGAVIEVEEMLMKTRYEPVNASPIIFKPIIRFNDDLFINDKDGNFVNNEVTTSHIVSFEKKDKKVMAMRPDPGLFEISKVSDDTAYGPPSIEGSSELLYFYEPNVFPEDENGVLVFEEPANETFYVAERTNLYTKFENTWDKLGLFITCAFINNVSGKISDYRLFNYRTNAWEKLDDLKRPGGNNPSDFTAQNYTDRRIIDIDVEQQLLEKNSFNNWSSVTTYDDNNRVLHNSRLWTSIQGSNTDNTPAVGSVWWHLTINDFRDEQSAAVAANEFTHDRIKWYIRAPTLSGDSALWIWEALATVTFHNDNEPEFSTATIASVTATRITLDAGTVNLPEEDGFGVGDIMNIVKNLDDYLQDAWDNSSLAAALGALIINITNSTSLAVIEDYSKKSFFDLMQFIDETTNSTFWANYGDPNTVEIASADNLVDSLITLTEDDIHDFNLDSWSITYDPTKQRKTLLIIGDGVEFTKTLNPSHVPDLGDETEIIEDNTIKTVQQASDLADSLTPQYENSEVLATIPINFSQPNQNYANLKMGKEVSLVITDNICNFTGATRLTIIGMNAKKDESTGDQEIITLTLQRRYTI